ncbi:MAG: immunity 17 family protein [Bacteroides sp.]
MRGQYIVQSLFALAGITALLAALLNWNWFFSTRNAKSIIANVGRKKARLFYGILGIIILGMALFFFIATRQAIAMEHLN